jgi:hypothetical protein
MITLPRCVGGARTTAGKHDALSWRMRRPSEYSDVSMSRACGGNSRRFSTCASRVKFLRDGEKGGEAGEALRGIDEQTGRNAHSTKGIPKDKPASLESIYGLVGRPFQGVYPSISRDPSWFEGMRVSTMGEKKRAMSVTYPFGHHPPAPVRCRSWHLA